MAENGLAPKERPLLFSGEMVRAILERGKSQTRRLIKGSSKKAYRIVAKEFEDSKYGRTGDRLWVRETWRTHEHPDTCIDGFLMEADGAFVPIANTREAAEQWGDYHTIRATPKEAPTKWGGLRVRKPHGNRWRPSIHMPRVACRLVLEITGVRIEPVRDMTHADARAEGIYRLGNGWTWDGINEFKGPILAYANLWDRINPADPWVTNPSVFVISFKRVEATS